MRTVCLVLFTALGSGLQSQAALQIENAALRHQLTVLQRQARGRPRLRPVDRLFWTWLCHLWPGWRRALVIVKPDTVLRWHRRGFRCYWRWKSRPRGPGRPRIPRAVQVLIRQMCHANPAWGAPRIHGGLLKLGIAIAEATVGHYMVLRRPPPSQTWRTFLTNHIGQLVSVDFFVVPTLTFRVLFVFVVLAHDRRQILHVNVTGYPTAAWAACTTATIVTRPDDRHGRSPPEDRARRAAAGGTSEGRQPLVDVHGVHGRDAHVAIVRRPHVRAIGHANRAYEVFRRYRITRP